MDKFDNNDNGTNSGATNGNKNEKLAPGRYNAKVVSARHDILVDDAGDDYDYIHLALEITDGPEKGQIECKDYHIKSEKAKKFFENEFAKIGVHVTDPDEFDMVCSEIESELLTISVRNMMNGNRAVYITGKGGGPKKKFDRRAIWKKD